MHAAFLASSMASGDCLLCSSSAMQQSVAKQLLSAATGSFTTGVGHPASIVNACVLASSCLGAPANPERHRGLLDIAMF